MCLRENESERRDQRGNEENIDSKGNGRPCHLK
jgi:hypothetical protein